MFCSKENHSKKWSALFLALMLAAAVPFAAFAESTAGTDAAVADASASASVPGRFSGFAGGFGRGGASLDESTLTDEQKAVYEKATTLYEQIEDAVLADLVTAAVVTQADVDSYTALREAEKSLADLDQSNWTAAQYKAYYEATALTGDARQTALQNLVQAGQLTQAQADALNAENQENLWNRIAQNEKTNSVIQTAMNTLQQARRTMNETLREAGIASVGNGNGDFGFGKDSGNQNGAGPMGNRNGMDNQMQGGPGRNNPNGNQAGSQNNGQQPGNQTQGTQNSGT